MRQTSWKVSLRQKTIIENTFESQHFKLVKFEFEILLIELKHQHYETPFTYTHPDKQKHLTF